MTCRVTPCHRINFPMAWNPKIHTRYLLVENSNFIGDKSGRMLGSSRAEDVCWDKQGHQGLSVLIHNTMPLCIDNNTTHSMHTMQIIYNIVYLFIIFCSYWQQYCNAIVSVNFVFVKCRQFCGYHCTDVLYALFCEWAHIDYNAQMHIVVNECII